MLDKPFQNLTLSDMHASFPVFPGFKGEKKKNQQKFLLTLSLPSIVAILLFLFLVLNETESAVIYMCIQILFFEKTHYNSNFFFFFNMTVFRFG